MLITPKARVGAGDETTFRIFIYLSKRRKLGNQSSHYKIAVNERRASRTTPICNQELVLNEQYLKSKPMVP